VTGQDGIAMRINGMMKFIINILKATQLPGLSVSRWNPFFADVNVAGVNKAMGINEFASYYGFDVSRTIAFGDGGNDISMIRAAGMGIAMGGASEAVKSVADYITEAVDENGVRNALVRFGILE
jgi:hydroxymethylpyrimidine pyrophosphatase-like HAD family hydrolase